MLQLVELADERCVEGFVGDVYVVVDAETIDMRLGDGRNSMAQDNLDIETALVDKELGIPVFGSNIQHLPLVQVLVQEEVQLVGEQEAIYVFGDNRTASRSRGG